MKTRQLGMNYICTMKRLLIEMPSCNKYILCVLLVLPNLLVLPRSLMLFHKVVQSAVFSTNVPARQDLSKGV